jgi:hypothetical protein
LVILVLLIPSCTYQETSPTETPIKNQTNETLIPNETPLPSKLFLDSDEDGFNDWFEENIATTYNQNIPNDRYVISFECWEEGVDNNGVDSDLEFFGEVAMVPAKNIIALKQKEATRFNLQAVIEEVAAKADENDIVCLGIYAHGSKTGIMGYKSHIAYADIDKWLDEVNAKAIIISICACDFHKTGASTLENGCCPRIIIPKASYYNILDPSFMNFAEADENGNKDGYVSMGELKKYLNHIYYKDDPDYLDYRNWVRDTSNISSQIYLTDYKIPS